MHEGHFTEQIAESIIAQMKAYPGKQIKSVTVRVGEVYHLLPDAMRMHFELVTHGTALQGVELKIKEEAMLVECLKCRRQGPVEDHHVLMCPYCHSRAVEVVSGDQINIEEVVFLP